MKKQCRKLKSKSKVKNKKITSLLGKCYNSLTEAALTVGIESQLLFIRLLERNNIGILFSKNGAEFHREYGYYDHCRDECFDILQKESR